jgi:hypothetical protein
MAIGGRGHRLKRIAVFSVPLALGGAYWFVRNLIASGSPLPSVRLAVGPVGFPSSGFLYLDKFGFSIATYLTDVTAWRNFFLPGLALAFGRTWWLTLSCALAGVVALLLLGNRVHRVLGAVIIIAIVGELITPNTAGGVRNAPVLFAGNLRFITPLVAIALIAPASLPALRAGRRRLAVMAVLGAAFFGEQLFPELSLWSARKTLLLPIAAGVIFALIGLALLRNPRFLRRPPIRMALGAAGVCALVLGGAWGAPRYYLSRYASSSIPAEWQWARGVHEQRIAVQGYSLQYPLYGSDLSNYVQFIGDRGHYGEIHVVQSCFEQRRLLHDGGYRYIVIGNEYPQNTPRPDTAWTQSASGAEMILKTPTAMVFRLDAARMSPVGCN